MVAGCVAVVPFGATPGAGLDIGQASPTIFPPLRRLRSYQAEGLRYARRVKHPALFWQMRLGKTLVAIRATKANGPGRVLVVAPYSAFDGWREDLQAEREAPPVELTGDRKTRLSRLREALNDQVPGRRWFLLNKEGWMVIPEVAEIRWGTVILDESTFIKEPKTKVSKFFLRSFREARHRWVLSGTAAPESDLDLWCQLAFLDPDILGRGNFWTFRQNVAEQRRFDWVLTPAGRAFITQRLAGRVSFLSRAQVKMGGVKVREKRIVQLPAEARKIYKDLARTFILEAPGEEERKTIFAGQRHIWFRRLADGLVPEFSEPVVHRAKIDELKELMAGELQGQQLVIWAIFVAEVEWLAGEIPGADFIHGEVSPAERDRKRRDFQAGIIPHLVIQPETMKFGTKMTAAGALIYFSTPEGALTREQSEDRAIDLAFQDNALIIDLITEGTIDEDIAMSLLRKESRSEALKRIVRGIERAAA